jgi:hypothetical protein
MTEANHRSALKSEESSEASESINAEMVMKKAARMKMKEMEA